MLDTQPHRVIMLTPWAAGNGKSGADCWHPSTHSEEASRRVEFAPADDPAPPIRAAEDV